MLVGFKEFITRGNVVDLAVAVVIGAAFGAVVTSLVADLVTPLVGAIIGEPDFGGLTFTINSSEFTYGNFINALIAFISIAAAVYFFVVASLNAMKKDEEEPAARGPQRDSGCGAALPVLHGAINANARRIGHDHLDARSTNA